MSEWWTYRLSDFLLFSPRAYYRLVEIYNREIWPLQLPLFAIGCSLFALVRRRDLFAARLVAAMLAAAWLWVGIGFEWRQFAQINWFATYVAGGFVLQAALLIWIGVIKGRLSFGQVGRARTALGNGLILLGVIGYPILDLAFGRGVAGIGTFGSMPDPTVAATLGVLFLSSGKPRWILLLIPILSSLLSGAMLYAMQAPDWWVALVVAGMGVGAVFRRSTPASESHIR
ncbi:MAG: hypothetical protein HOP28_15350 [Gemmatimonadales bacterium]|nr:hypothetical protein [Gemmatimonadales bacterium]